MPGDGSVEGQRPYKHIIVKRHGGELQIINELHPAYMPLHFPLLFPRGDLGYQLNIPYAPRNGASGQSRRAHADTLGSYVSYVSHCRCQANVALPGCSQLAQAAPMHTGSNLASVLPRVLHAQMEMHAHLGNVLATAFWTMF